MLAQLAYLNQLAIQMRKKNKRVKINLHNASVAAKKAAERALEEQLAQEQALQEQIAQEQIAQEQALQEQIAQEQALAEQLAQEQALAEQLAQEQALQEQIADEKVDPENKNIFLNAFKHANTKADECVIKPSVVSNNNQGSLFLNSIKHSLQ